MAVTSIWPITVRLNSVIKYACNPEKTTQDAREETSQLHKINDVVQYTANDMKTEHREFVSGMDLDIAMQKLKLLKANHLSQKYALEDQIIKDFPQRISSLEQRIEGYKVDMAHLTKHTQPNEDGFSPMEIEGTVFTEKKAAGSAILEACHAMTSPDAVPLGQYRGFTMELSFDSFSREYKITMKNELRHTTSIGTDIFGNIQRLDNSLSGFEERLYICEEELENSRAQLANAKEQVQKPFPQEEELKTKSARLDELNIMLNMDKTENEIVDDEREEDEPDGRSSKEYER